MFILAKRNTKVDDQENQLFYHHQHQRYSSSISSFPSKSDWFTELFEFIFTSRIFVELFKCVHLLVAIPFRCLGTFRRRCTKWKSNVLLPRSSFISNSRKFTKCEYGSLRYFVLCGISGMISCGTTHTFLLPLDLIKCRLQVKPQKYLSFLNGFRITISEEGLMGLTKGWAATLIGYSFQGLGKFGFYEVFKIFYASLFGEENAYQYRTILYLLSSASAELFADVALAPWEATKVRIQTQDNWASSLRRGVPKLYAEEGIWGFYKGLVPLWLRQIPYTMMKFACFERTIEAIYKYVVSKPRDKCSKSEQLSVTFIAGYIAGIFCAIVSHPADTIVSKLNNEKGLHLFDAVRRIGFAGLWKGLGTRIIMIGTLTALQWFIYDSIKVIFRIPPPPEPTSLIQRKLSSSHISHPLKRESS